MIANQVGARLGWYPRPPGAPGSTQRGESGWVRRIGRNPKWNREGTLAGDICVDPKDEEARNDPRRRESSLV